MQDKKTAVAKLQNLEDSLKSVRAAQGLAAQQQQQQGSAGSDTVAAAVAADTSPPAHVALCSAGICGKEARELRLLDNRLEKAMLKGNEARSLQHTYEQVGRVGRSCTHAFISPTVQQNDGWHQDNHGMLHATQCVLLCE